MQWKNPIDDPIPSLLIEAHSRGAMQDRHPCSKCRATPKEEGFIRSHFHASDMGKCKRRVLYSMRYPIISDSSTSPEFLKDGHLHESSMLVNIANGFTQMHDIQAMMGEVIVYPANNEEEHEGMLTYMEGDLPIQVYIIAHYDALLHFVKHRVDYTTFILECKSVKPFKWKQIVDGEMDKEWYGQTQTYMRMFNVPIAYILCKNRETSQLATPIRMELDSIYLKERREALVEIHKALLSDGMVNREHTKKTDSECKWCKFADKCWTTPNINQELKQKYPIDMTLEDKIKSEEGSIYDD